MTPHREWFDNSTFTNLKDPILVSLGDGSTIFATGKGIVPLSTTVNRNTNSITLECLYIPKLAATLISITGLTKKGTVSV
jgi:hypothetical protein